MRTMLRSKVTLLFLAFAVAIFAVSGAAMALTTDGSGTTSLSPTIQSDKADYAPGELVTLTGSNWQPGESVNVVVNDDEGQSWNRNVNVTADASGNISDSFNLPDWFVATYKVTATGAQSGVATSSFTDGNVKVTSGSNSYTFVLNWTQHNGTNSAPSNTCNSTNTTTGSEPAVGNSGGAVFQKGVDRNSSIVLNAADTASNGFVFTGWKGETASDTFLAQTDPHAICVTGDFTGSRSYFPQYELSEAPTLTRNNASVTVNEGQTAANTGTWSDANELDTVTLSASVGTVTKNADGTWSWSYATTDGPPQSQTVTITATDNHGKSSTTTFALTVNNVAPTAVNDNPAAVAEGGTVTLNVLANDTDPAGSNDPLTVTNNTNGQHGTVNCAPTGSCTYTPNDPDFYGTDSFTYTVGDGDGGTSVGTVNVTVTPVDDNPVAVNDNKTVAEDDPATTINVLANDTDVDGGPKTITSASDPANGTVVVAANGSDLTYKPDENYCGSDSFTYTLNGGSTATVAVTVTCVDDAPVAVNDNKTVAEDDPATTIDVLNNDTDADGGPKTIASVTQAAHGTVAITNGGNDLTYKPNGDYCGSDSFTYTLNGGSTATVSVTVTCVNDNPVITTVTNNGPVNEGSPATITVTANDPDGNTLSYEFDCDNDGNYAAAQSGNTYQCTFNDEGTGPYKVNARVTDGNGGTATGSTNVVVNNAIPTIGPLTVTGNSGTACIGSNNVVKLSFSITDPGTTDTHSGTINWGDGTTTPFSGSSVTDAQHSYSAGTYNITVNASDNDGGNAAPRTTTTAQQVSLLYKVSELHDPVNPSTAATMSVFKSGSTVPLKVLITDCNNQPVNGLVPRISFNRINPSTPALGVNEALSTQPNDTNFLMRDAGNGQYIYNLNTKTLPDQDATYSATITDSKATSTAPATYGPKVSQTFGIRTK